MPSARAASVRELPGVRRADPVAVLRATTDTPERANVNLIGVVPGGVGSPPGSARVLQAGGAAIADESLGLCGRRSPRPERRRLPGRRGDVRDDLLRGHTDRDRLAGRRATARARRTGPRYCGPHARPSHSPAVRARGAGERRGEGGPRPPREPGSTDDLPDPRAVVDRGRGHHRRGRLPVGARTGAGPGGAEGDRSGDARPGRAGWSSRRPCCRCWRPCCRSASRRRSRPQSRCRSRSRH